MTMPQTIANPLEVYLQQVLSDDDKRIFQEAVAVLSVNARRATYVMLWISCAEGLKRKFRELAVRDHKAQAVVTKIIQMESQRASVDHTLLKEAKDYGFLTDAEFARLENVYAMRCLYAHPYEQEPTDESLVAAAADVTSIVLGRQTKLRHGYLTNQAKLLATDLNFLDDLESVVEQYADEVFNKTDDGLRLWFLQKLWAESGTIITDPSLKLIHKRVVWFSRYYLRRGGAELFNTWEPVGDLSRYPLVLTRILGAPELFRLLERQPADMVVGNLIQYSSTTPILLERMQRLDSANCLTPRQQERFRAAIEEIPLTQLALMRIDLPHYVERVIADLKSHNWHIQNPAIEVISNVGKNAIAQISRQMQFILGNNVLQSADGGSRAARLLLSKIAEDPDPNWPTYFIEGILAECVINDDNLIRFKESFIKEAILCLRAIDINEREIVVRRILQRIPQGQIVSWKTRPEDRDRMVELLGDAISAKNDLEEGIRPMKEWLEGLEFEGGRVSEDSDSI